MLCNSVFLAVLRAKDREKMNSHTAYNKLYDNTTILSYWSNSEAIKSSEESQHATCEMFPDSQAECVSHYNCFSSWY